MGCAASVNVNNKNNKNNNEAEVTNNGLDHQSIETNNEIILCNSITTTTENDENNNNNNNTMAMMMVPVQVILDADGTFTKIVGEFTVEDALPWVYRLRRSRPCNIRYMLGWRKSVNFLPPLLYFNIKIITFFVLHDPPFVFIYIYIFQILLISISNFFLTIISLSHSEN
eukprot:PhM_4_TR16088/c0_g1_i1/m.92045